MSEVTYLKCNICGEFYETGTQHICRSIYFRKSSASKKVAFEIKNIISRRLYGRDYEHDDPRIYTIYTSLLSIARLNLGIRSRYPWSFYDANRILLESKRILGEGKNEEQGRL